MQLPNIFTVNPDDLYDLIMVHIETDLLTSNVKKLDTKYATETTEQKVARMQRYKDAMEQYKKAKEAYFIQAQQEVDAFLQNQRAAAEATANTEEQGTLQGLEAMFN